MIIDYCRHTRSNRDIKILHMYDVVLEFEFLGTRGSSFRTDWLPCVIVNPTLNVIVFWNVYYMNTILVALH